MNRIRALLTGVAAFAACATGAVLADPVTVYGQAKGLGEGFAQVYAELDAVGAPRVIGVSFDQGMLEGLPTMPNTWSRCFDKNEKRPDRCSRRMQWRLRAPVRAAAGAGAAPGHAILMGQRQLQSDGPPAAGAAGLGGAPRRLPLLHHAGGGGGADPARPVQRADPLRRLQARPDAGACGLRACRPHRRRRRGPRHGQSPDRLEVTRAGRPGPGVHPYLHLRRLRRPGHVLRAYDHPRLPPEPARSCAVPIKQPEAWATGGYYPTTYCIRHLPDDERYTVSLEDFVHRTAD